MQKRDISTPHPDAAAMHEDIRLARTLWGGTEAMRKAGKLYLPKEPAEDEEAYRDRLNRSVLFNALGKTVKDMVGRVFSKDIVLGSDVPPLLAQYSENVDLTGCNISVFASDAFRNALIDGIAYVLTDAPAGEGATRANQGRPYWVLLMADQIIGWTSETYQDSVRLTSFRFYETVDVRDGYHIDRVTQIRVLIPFGYEVWRQNEKNEWILAEAGSRDMEEIPVSPIYLNRNAYMTGSPPLQDLCDLNVAHWQSASDQRNILHVARVPILFGSGFAEDAGITVGASSMTRASDPAAKLMYVEHSGAAIGAGREDLQDLETRMQAMGLQLLVDQSGRSATGENRDNVKENSILAGYVGALKDGLENALMHMAEMASLPDGGSLVINKDFGIAIGDVNDINAILTAYRDKVISHETALNELLRRGFISDSVDTQEEMDRVAEDSLAAIEDAQATADAQIGSDPGGMSDQNGGMLNNA